MRRLAFLLSRVHGDVFCGLMSLKLSLKFYRFDFSLSDRAGLVCLFVCFLMAVFLFHYSESTKHSEAKLTERSSRL